jgi:hypothetical protein
VIFKISAFCQRFRSVIELDVDDPLALSFGRNAQ